MPFSMHIHHMFWLESKVVGTWAGGPKGPLGVARILGVDFDIRPPWAGRPPIDFYHRKNLFGIRNS
eukprot:1146984-Pelagomonas_calceolata.AAC.9